MKFSRCVFYHLSRNQECIPCISSSSGGRYRRTFDEPGRQQNSFRGPARVLNQGQEDFDCFPANLFNRLAQRGQGRDRESANVVPGKTDDRNLFRDLDLVFGQGGQRANGAITLFSGKKEPVRLFAEGSPRGNFTLLLKFGDGSGATMHHTMVGNFDYPKELFEATRNNITVAMEQHLEVRQLGLTDEPVLQTFPYAAGGEWAGKEGITGYLLAVDREQKKARAEGRPPRHLSVDKGHYRHLDRFLDCIEGKGPNPCDVESAVPVNRLALKCLESAASGLPIALGPEVLEV